MKIAIETSSLFPLYVFTSYSAPLYEELNNFVKEGAEIIVHQDSIDEAKQISILTKSNDIVEFMQRFHNNNKLSFMRSILEYFPGNMFGNNSSRAVSLFVLDVLDGIPDNLNHENFKELLKINIERKIKIILDGLTPKDEYIIANPKLVQSYWHPRVDISKYDSINIRVRENTINPKSTKNKDRDIFHYKLIQEDGDIEELIVCDQGYAKQIPKDMLSDALIHTIKSINLSKLRRIY